MPEDYQSFIGLLTGERKPDNPLEGEWLKFMGGVRGPMGEWEKKWTVCTECGSEWKQMGLPASHGKWIYHPVCKSCRREIAQTRSARRPVRPRADLDE